MTQTYSPGKPAFGSSHWTCQILRREFHQLAPTTYAGMSCVQTRYFGEMDHTEDAVIRTPLGIPGFETETSFLIIQLPAQYPLVYLQSMQTADVCFPALPVRVADAAYDLRISDEDCAVLGTGTRPDIGGEVLCLALLSADESGVPTANLMAPIVVRISSRVAVQCLNASGSYLCRQPLEQPALSEAVPA